MRKINLFAALLAVLSFAFFACERPEQSEMDLSILTDTATISGALVYDAGVDTAGSVDQYAVNQIKPVANRVIYVEIPYASYNFNNEQKGSKIYETVTDLDGNFTISVPTTSTGLQNVTVRMQEFTAYKSEYKKMDGSTPIFETDLYRYSWEKTNITLKPGSIDFLTETERKCTETKVTIEELTETITLTGNIQLAYESGFRKGIYKVAANATIEFEAEYYEGFEGVLTAGTVTDAQGNYRITLPLKSYKDGFKSLSVKVMGLVGTPYVHYSTPTTQQTLSGAFIERDILGVYGLSNIIEGMEYEMKTMYLRFTPGYSNNMANAVVPTTFTQNLVGWERYDGFTETATITGKYLLATSAGYGLGSFANPYGEGRFIIMYSDPNGVRLNRAVFAPVNADGTYSFTIPVSNQGEEISIYPIALNALIPDVSGNTIDAILSEREFKYTHYKRDNSTVVIQGIYDEWATTTDAAVRELDAEWNDLGDAYFLFTPSSSISTDQLSEIDWTSNLVDWIIDPNKRYKVSISANLYFPAETGFGVGSYVPADGRIVSVYAGGRYYSVPVKAGKLQFDVSTEKENEEINVDFATEIKNVTNYKHYTGFDNSTKVLNGSYQLRTWIGEYKKDREAWNELGDVYYKFIPDASYDLGLIKWNGNLAAWNKSVEKTSTRKVTANINFAAESAFGKGVYKPANNQIVEIFDGEFIYAAPVKNGKFEVNILTRDLYEEPTLTFMTSNVEDVKDYVHYTGTTSSDIRYLEGKYSFYLWDGANEEDRTSWADLGNVYYKFTPATTYDYSKIKWNNNLAGWVKSSSRTHVNQVYVDVMFAVETGYAKGKYEPANGLIFEISDGYNIYAAPAENGKVVIDVLVKDEFTAVSAIWNPNGITYQFDEFVHYYDGATGKTRKLEGYYSDFVVENRLDSDPIEKLGTIYLKFTPNNSSIELQQMNWFENLAGWVANINLKITKTVEGYIYRAVETGFWQGSYIPAEFEKVTVEVNGVDFIGATDKDGHYSIDVRLEYDETPIVYVYDEITSKEYEFDHYRRPNTTDIEKIGVRYGNKFTDYKEGLDSWTNRRSTYYRVTSHGYVDYWTNNIAGWINQYYKTVSGYNKTLNVKGSVKRAIEAKDGGVWAAKWTNDAYRMLEIEIEGRTYNVAATGSGTYSIPVTLEEIGTDYYVAVEPLRDMDDMNYRVKFTHYYEVDKTDSEVILGRYVDAGVIDGTNPITVTGTTLDIKEPCVKVVFDPNYTPMGWSNYVWDPSLDL